MGNRIFLTGTHNAGKTTLAEQIANGCKIPFITSRAKEIQENFGCSASEDIPIKMRLDIQEKILSDWCDQMKATATSGAIFDRCPLDFAAYMMADVQRSMNDIVSQPIQRYISHCLEICMELENVFLVFPLEGVAQQEGKPNIKNGAYADHIHYLITGFLTATGIKFFAVPPGPIERRVYTVHSALEVSFGEETQKEILKRNGTKWQSQEIRAQ